MMKILTVGDSFTYGVNSSDPLVYSWPAQLSQKYNVEVCNLAEPGCSNQRVLRLLTDELLKNKYDQIFWPIGPASRSEIMVRGGWQQAFPNVAKRFLMFKRQDYSNLDLFCHDNWHLWNDVCSVISLAFQAICLANFFQTKIHISSLSFFSDLYHEFESIRKYKNDYKFFEAGLPTDIECSDKEYEKTVCYLKNMLNIIELQQPNFLYPIYKNYLNSPEQFQKYNYNKIEGHPDNNGYTALADYYANEINLKEI